jgi:hypothetical protein
MKPTKEIFDRIKELNEEIQSMKDDIDDNHIGEVAFLYTKSVRPKQIHNVPSCSGNFSSDWTISENTIKCPWSDSWRYGGYDEGYEEVPIEYFHDDEKLQQFIKDADDFDNRVNKIQEELELAKKRALFEQLKKELE